MDKFDKIIKQAVEGYQAPYNPQAWENVSKDLGDSFDQMMKETANNYKASYNPAAWEAVSGQITSTSSTWKWIAGSAAALALIFGSAYLIDTNSSDEGNSSVNEQSDLVVSNDGNGLEDNTAVTFTDDNTDIIKSNSNGNGIIQPIDTDLTNNVDPIIDNVEENGIAVVTQPSEEDPNESQVKLEENISNGATNTETIVNYDDANASFTTDLSIVCVGSKCIFTPEAVNSNLIYIWNFGDGGLSASQLGTHTFNRAGEFIVKLEVKHPRTNKTITSSKKLITVNALPKTNFEWEQSSEIIPIVSFINLTNEATKWAWNIKGIAQSSRNEFEHTFRKAGKYLVELTAENQDGCRKSIQKTIKIANDYNLLAPTAFNPNGNGENDFFIPKALKIMEVDFTMTVMDKSGKLVYSTQNAFEPWDGRYTEDNKLANNGSSYIWHVVLTNNNGEEEMYHGQVFVIR